MTGVIKQIDSFTKINIPPPTTDLVTLKAKDVYKELRLRGYEYSGVFQSLIECRMDAQTGKIAWNNNFVAFIDVMLQMSLMAKDSRVLYLPVEIENIKIDPNALDFQWSSEVFVKRSKYMNLIQAGGVEIFGLKAKPVARKPHRSPVLESYQFIPFFPVKKLSESNIGRYIVQLIVENNPIGKQIEAVEINESDDDLLKILQDALDDIPLVKSKLTVCSQSDAEKLEKAAKLTLLICSDLLANKKLLQLAKSCTSDFVVSRESGNLKPEEIPQLSGFDIISSVRFNAETIVVFKKELALGDLRCIKVSTLDRQFSWLREVQKGGKIVLYSEKEPLNGLLGLINCARREPNGANFSAILIDDETAPNFDKDEPFYCNQLRKGLAINVYRKVCRPF